MTSNTKSPKQSRVTSSADRDELLNVFNRYAHHEHLGERYMTPHEFLQDYLGYLIGDNIDPTTLDILSSLVDLNKDQKITLTKFINFESLLLASDSLYRLAFQLFDRHGQGFITFDDFQYIISATKNFKEFPFNFNSDFVTTHFGAKRQRQITYKEFTQILLDFIDDQTIQAFRKFDKDNLGCISFKNFEIILNELRQYQLAEFISKHLNDVVKLSCSTSPPNQISYSYFTAFLQLLSNIESMRKIYLAVNYKKAHTYKSSMITKEEFLTEAQHFSYTTPLQIDILFAITHLLHKDHAGHEIHKDYIELSDFDLISANEHLLPYRLRSEIVDEYYKIEHQSIFMKVLESGYRFTLGSIAGAIGATAVYPIDLVKTRMQNQRTTSVVGERLYRNSIDCFKKVIRHEGVFGLYRGLIPQLVGVAPEKAIKLTVNDFIRDRFTLADGTIPFWSEILAGGCAGASQVTFTNPLEIVKIRLQVAGEIQSVRRPAASEVVRELGLRGLYKGARACFLRDIPFSSIYFPAYAHTKRRFADEHGYNDPKSLFFSGLLAGIPAAGLCTPADVVKTRLQVQARKGQTKYNGLTDAFKKIYIEEGWTAFWKGAGARMLRSSPQFAFTLLTYELLQRSLNIDFQGRKLEGSKHVDQEQYSPKIRSSIILSTNSDHVGGFHLAQATFEGIETRFGLAFPKYKSSTSKDSTSLIPPLTSLLGVSTPQLINPK
ncbi:unnamed protein product [Rotaria socialis]|uniref:EF-hand domain-containing protein n=3 Tax=Rotaria socialis TaxID=392032 RepID=A0A818AL03_9BILA|nr:unnamed protein product [Rotaria socialis]CAF3228726.1 unnamed protein product [Rotaria socialis]CAF3344168.1 unnamed protein product [Rotaria socialis]CAF3408770.1 unnamed protein product [Rotaria socialis]CAF4328894.1 unnamed protein product [Rotaria socialis]